MHSGKSNTLSQIAAITLNDLRFYLTGIEPVIYLAPMDLISGSTIGQHTRHIIEFYNCLLESADNSQCVVNYANRRRDYLIETRPDHALQHVHLICERLNDLNTDQACFVDCAEHGQEGLLVASTIGREIIYNIEHTIHHLAILKIALKAILPSFNLPEHFGIAPSTIRHRHEACAQ